MVIKSTIAGDAGSGPGALRRVHRALVLRALFQQAGIDRSELARQIGLSAMGIGRIVRELEEAGLVVEVNSGNAGRGRPAANLQLNAGGIYVVGTVISAYSREVHLINLHGESVAHCALDLADVTHGPSAVDCACEAIDALISDAGIPAWKIQAAGFAVSANVDSARRLVVGGGYLGWSQFDVAQAAGERLGMPVTVENLSSALLRHEVFNGMAAKSPATVLIHASTTLGASHGSQGQLTVGANNRAGRVGHFPMRRTMLICSCGQSDCLNCSASGWAILNRLGLLPEPAFRHDQILQYSRLLSDLVAGKLPPGIGRKRLQRVLSESGAALARGLRFLELTYDPALFILAGPLAGVEAYYRGVVSGLQPGGADGTAIAAKLSRCAVSPALGAGSAALQDIVFSPGLDIAARTAGNRQRARQ